MNKNYLFAVIAIVILIGGGIWLVGGKKQSGTQEKKAAHFETATPEHNAVLAGVPINVVVNFDFDLASGSTISVQSEGKEYAEGDTRIDENKLAMRRAVNASAPDGTYAVTYKACWADGSCHDGAFQFTIDRSQAENYEDMRGKSEVTISMSEIMFKPKNIRVSKGTKIIWKNDEAVEHYVNTDSHPAHTYFAAQNSRALKQGDTYETKFDQAGIYPYHCSAHAHTMTGNILVE